MPPVDRRGALFWLAVVTLAVLALFGRWPGIDLGVSWIFFTPGQGFLAGQQTWLEVIRKTVWGLSLAMVALALAGTALTWRLRRPLWRLGMGDWGFILALYLLAPVLLVEGMLKRLWGRARPADIADFGGARRFTAATDITDQCQRNCSFVSGEVAGSVALALALGLILWRWRDRLGDGARRAARIVLVTQAVLVAVQRIASGRHFLSDALIAALLTLAVGAALLPLLRGSPDPGPAPGRGR